MTTDNAKIKVSVSEVAQILQWPYTTANSIKHRKSPKSKYAKYLECERMLIAAKENINKELANQK